MPKGPQGQKRPADTVALAVMVGRIATGEIIEPPVNPKGSAGGHARAAVLPQTKRSEIAKLAAERRWQGEKEIEMHAAVKETTVAHGREAVRMYPNNSLRDPVNEYRNVVAEVVKNTFTK